MSIMYWNIFSFKCYFSYPHCFLALDKKSSWNIISKLELFNLRDGWAQKVSQYKYFVKYLWQMDTQPLPLWTFISVLKGTASLSHLSNYTTHSNIVLGQVCQRKKKKLPFFLFPVKLENHIDKLRQFHCSLKLFISIPFSP